MVNAMLMAALLSSAASHAVTAPWVKDSFESYENHQELLNAWPYEGEYQDARLSTAQCVGGGRLSLEELSHEGSRNYKVFDPTDSVNGTDEQPLQLSFGFYIERNPDKTFRSCEVRNSQTGERIAVGAANAINRFQVFDGIAWRTLAMSVERIVGWTHLELFIKTDTLGVRITNVRGQSYEEVPRATRASFGILTIGSGRANHNSPTYVDNLTLEGGTLRGLNEPAAMATELTPEEMEIVFRANSALQLYHQKRKGQEALAGLEALLEEVERLPANANVRAGAVMAWIYEAIASLQEATDEGQQKLQAIHYESIVRAPDGIGVDAAVRNLASLLNEPDRTRFLFNVACEHKQQAAGRCAAKLMLEPFTGEISSAAIDRLRQVLQQSSGTPIPEAVAQMLSAARIKQTSAQQSVWYLIDILEDSAFGRELFSAYAGHQTEARHTARPQSLASWQLSVVRESLFKARFEAGDIFGALAALSDHPLSDGRRALVQELAEAAEIDTCRRLLSTWVARAVRVKFSAKPVDSELPPPPTPKEAMWQAIAEEAEVHGLWIAAISAYQELALSHGGIAAADGAQLGSSFAIGQAPPEEAVDLWKAYFLLAAQRPWQAEPLLSALSRSKCRALAGQAAFDLVGARRAQYRPQAATQPAALCESINPASPAVRELKTQLGQDLARRQERRTLHEALEKAWSQAREAREPAQAAAALMQVAELEDQLGSPQRAAEALEVMVAKYPEVPSLPMCLDRLAHVYEQGLKRMDKAQAVRERLARDFPTYQPAVQASAPSGNGDTK